MSKSIERKPEQEIIPPGQPLPSVMWVGAGSRRVYSARTGPVSLMLIALAVGFVGALGLVVLLGIAVISLIIGGLLTAAFIIASILRKPPQPLR